MARGIDINGVKYVISYDSPLHLKTYIHRVGRTARAGKAGTAYTLLLNKEVSEKILYVSDGIIDIIVNITVLETVFLNVFFCKISYVLQYVILQSIIDIMNYI